MALHVLGIDIGSYAAKAVRLGRIREGRATLLGLGLSGLPKGAVTEWEDKPAQVGAVISGAMRNLVKRGGLSGKYVSVSVSGDSVIVKKIIMPLSRGEALAKSVMAEAEQYIPFPPAEVNLSWHVLETYPADNQMALLLVAAKKTVVNNYTEAIALAKLKAAVIDVDGLALFNAYNFLRGGQEGDVVLADIGASRLNIAVLSGGLPMVIKDEPGGGAYLTDELAAAFDLDEAQAEAIKFGAAAAPDPGRAAEIADRAVGNWIAAVERVLDAARGEDPSYRPSAIYLSGGSSLLRGLTREFENYFGMGTALLNPLAGLDYNPKKYDPAYLEYIGPQMAVSFGLALRKVEVE